MPPQGRALVVALCAVAAVSCSSVPDAAPEPTVDGGVVQIRMRLTAVGPGWQQEFEKTRDELSAQSMRGLDRPLRLTFASIPITPPPGAEVTVRFAISSTGQLVKSRVMHTSGLSGSAGSDALASMVRSLPQWRFAPPMQAGKPIAYCCVQLTFD